MTFINIALLAFCSNCPLGRPRNECRDPLKAAQEAGQTYSTVKWFKRPKTSTSSKTIKYVYFPVCVLSFD